MRLWLAAGSLHEVNARSAWGEVKHVFQLKNFNIKIPADTLVSIDEVRAKRPRKPTSPKLGISTQDWLLEAIAEKLEREQKKYKIGAV